MWLFIQQWLRKGYDLGYSQGLDTGYRLGYQMGQIEATNHQYCGLNNIEPQSLVDKQVEIILKQKEVL